MDLMVTASPIPKQQHWIPRFYLEYFAATYSKKGQPQVWFLSRNREASPKPKLVGVNGICKQGYLYTPKLADSEERDPTLDQRLTDLESLMASFWPLVANEDAVFSQPSFKKGLALFMATLYLRHPTQIEVHKELHRQLRDAVAEFPPDERGVPHLEEMIIRGKRYPVDTSDWEVFRDAGQDYHHRAFTAGILSNTGKLAQLLLEKRWSVLKLENPTYITSDYCVAVHHPSGERVGLRTPGALVTFPLSPTRVLLLDDQKDIPGNQYYNDPQKGVVSNFLVWRGAAEFMISSRHPDEVLREIYESSHQIAGKNISDGL